MTFPLKEQFIQFEQLEKLQRRVYDDATDFGVKYKDVNLTTARDALKDLMKVYPYKASQWATGKNVRMFIPIEEAQPGYVHGYGLKVTANNDKKVDGGGFLSIEIDNCVRSHQNTLLEY